MAKVYFTAAETAFGSALKILFAQQGYEVVSTPQDGIEYFIDTTDAYVESDVRGVGQGFDPDAALEAYRLNVCAPIAELEQVLPLMTGKKRICFVNTKAASINYSEETVHFGHNMAKAALNQILTITKNGLIEKGYTFRLFDPLCGTLAPEKAAGSAFVYFTRDRYDDGPDNRFRQDERNLIVRDALGREIPW